ncbi:MAG: hypothetical protein AAF138_09425 [Planctomycetota bacterium]
MHLDELARGLAVLGSPRVEQEVGPVGIEDQVRAGQTSQFTRPKPGLDREFVEQASGTARHTRAVEFGAALWCHKALAFEGGAFNPLAHDSLGVSPAGGPRRSLLAFAVAAVPARVSRPGAAASKQGALAVAA